MRVPNVLAVVVSILLISACQLVPALDNGLGRKPPLGFNTWNYFGCNINETIIGVAADKLQSLGLADAGYTYVNIDDCWAKRSRDSQGQLQADPLKFPSGMQAVGQAIHAKGLKFGIYSDAGLFTCAGFPGSRFHEVDDASLFASWGVDYLKYDNCFAASIDVVQRYTAMRDALNNTGRSIYFSMCNWGVNEPWRWGPGVGNSWRTDADIEATWDSILRSLDNGAAGLGRFAGPGGWNDPDMLEVGNGRLTPAQQRSHFALWALVKAPLLIGANLDRLTATSLAILKSKEVIAINQDQLGVPGDIIWKEGPAEVWAAPLEGNARAVVLFNRHHAGNPIDITVTWQQLGYTTKPQLGYTTKQQLGCNTKQAGFTALVRDLYAEEDLGVFECGYTSTIANFDVAVLRISPAGQPSTAGSVGGSSSRSSVCSGDSDNHSSASWFAGWLMQAWSALGCAVQRVYCTAAAASGGWKGALARARCTVPGQAAPDQAAPAAAAAAAGGVQEAAWRPWHGAAAVQLQAQMRAAAGVRRQQAFAAGAGWRQKQRMQSRLVAAP